MLKQFNIPNLPTFLKKSLEFKRYIFCVTEVQIPQAKHNCCVFFEMSNKINAYKFDPIYLCLSTYFNLTEWSEILLCIWDVSG
jgi:hypothetical protein